MASASARRVATALAGCTGASRRFASIDARVVRYSRFGHALTPGVLKVETVRIDTSAIKPTDILVRILAAPITPTDVSVVAGFGSSGKVTFPRVAGNEGVGVVEAVGGAVSGLKKGDFVVASRSGLGTWSTHVVSDADAWTSLAAPAGTPELPIEVAATAVASPLLAKRLVETIGAGDVLVQNNAGSTVGQCVIQYAKAKGAKTVNIMRAVDNWDDKVYHLQGRGAGIVVNEDYARTPAFSKLLADLPAPRLGLNSVGGAAAGSVLKALGPGATFITYGSASGAAVRASTEVFTTRGLTLKGASLDASLRALPKAARDAEVRAAVADVTGGEKAAVVQLVAREPFADFSHALARAFQGGERKVVLTF